MGNITPKEAIKILRHYTDLGYGIVIEGEDTTKIKQALSLASKTLVNGTPYNPTGDLISRDALKEKLKERYYNDGLDIVTAIELIDNAPTVDIKDEIAGAYNEGFMCGNKEAEKARPQGEWIIVKDEKWGDNVKCPFCGKELAGTDLNFCCKCGADMRKDSK